jgi:hypothetical protein
MGRIRQRASTTSRMQTRHHCNTRSRKKIDSGMAIGNLDLPRRAGTKKGRERPFLIW